MSRRTALPLLLVGLLALTVVPITPARAAKSSFASREDVMLFLNTYRLKPVPKRLPEAVHAMSALGLFDDQETAGVYVGFVAGVLGSNQLQAKKLVERTFPLRPDEQVTMIRALAYSGLPEWKALLGSFAALMPSRAVLIERHLSGEAPGLMELPLDDARSIDTLWGYYIATGSYEPVQRLMTALAWSNEENDLDKLTAGSMAMWTLASNASRDENLLALYKVELQHRPAEIATPLKEVITAAETFELAPLRKKALASIDELKIKGPDRARKWAWAATAGSTVIALGCVVAGVAGQVELAVPCVLTGAVTQAAGKLLTAP